jgi:hypothetical protein
MILYSVLIFFLQDNTYIVALIFFKFIELKMALVFAHLQFQAQIQLILSDLSPLILFICVLGCVERAPTLNIFMDNFNIREYFKFFSHLKM